MELLAVVFFVEKAWWSVAGLQALRGKRLIAVTVMPNRYIFWGEQAKFWNTL